MIAIRFVLASAELIVGIIDADIKFSSISGAMMQSIAIRRRTEEEAVIVSGAKPDVKLIKDSVDCELSIVNPRMSPTAIDIISVFVKSLSVSSLPNITSLNKWCPLNAIDNPIIIRDNKRIGE